MPTIVVAVLEPDKPARLERVERTLETFQKLVGGYIEVVRLPGPLRMYVNEEGAMRALRANPRATRVAGGLILGTAVVFRDDGSENEASLNEVDFGSLPA